MKLRSGHEVVPVDENEAEKLAKDFRVFSDGMVRLMPGRWMCRPKMKKLADIYYSFKYKESDVVVMTWPKCGTTWVQEIIWTMMNNPNLDHPDAELPVLVRSPFLEADVFSRELSPDEVPPDDDLYYRKFKRLCPGKRLADGQHVQIADASPEPRIIKTHFPFSFLAPDMLDTCKVVYVARNPKDVVVSYHHFCRLFKSILDFVGSFDDFVQYFVDGDLVYGPYWLHLKEAWEKKHHPNLHFVFYEDMKKDILGEVKRFDAFLNTNLTEEQLESIIKYTSFTEMRDRDGGPVACKDIEMVNCKVVEKDGGFFRKGELGDWKGKLTPDQEAKIDQWIKKYLDSIGITFEYSA